MSQPYWVTSSLIVTDNATPWQQSIAIGRKQQNDLIIVCGLAGNIATTTITVNPGYTSFAKISGSNMVGQFFYKRAGASEGNPSISSSAGPLFGAAIVFAGVTQSGTPIDAQTISNNGLETSSVTPVGFSVTPTKHNTLLISCLAYEDDEAYTSGRPPANWAVRLGVSSSVGTDGRLECIVWNGVPTKSVATPTVNFGTTGVADAWGTVTLTLNQQLSDTYAMMLDDTIFKQ